MNSSAFSALEILAAQLELAANVSGTLRKHFAAIQSRLRVEQAWEDRQSGQAKW